MQKLRPTGEGCWSVLLVWPDSPGIRPDPLGNSLNSLGNCLGLLGFGSDKSGETIGKIQMCSGNSDRIFQEEKK